MKKTKLSILTFLLSLTISYSGYAQFNENMGTTGNSTLISSYIGWQNNGSFTYSGTGDVRSTTVSSSYSGASGGSNVFLTGTAGTTFQIATITTVTLTNPSISFGLYKSTIAGDGTDLKFEYSINGTSYTQILIPAQPTGSGTSAWRKILLTGLPVSTTLTIKFTNLGTSSTSYRIDDISVNSLSVLPISLTSFTAKPVDQTILLNWNTASEVNNNYFDVLRSVDGKSFSAIGKINGSGNFTGSKDYSFADENPYAGTNYYQLMQHDFDGKTSSSAIISADSKIAAAQLSVYANSSEVKISINSPNQSKGLLQLFDIAGRKLADQSVVVNKGFNSVVLPLSLQNGIHFVRYTTDGETINQKFAR